jgi:tRNA-splicing endonuclease subunit Sen34
MIDISIVGNAALVWDADAVYQLRKARIVGSLIGTLSKIPQQNIYLSLPLHLLPEEATLLVDQGLARLVNHSMQVNQQSLEQYTQIHADWIVNESEKRHADAAARKQKALATSDLDGPTTESSVKPLPIVRIPTSNNNIPWMVTNLVTWSFPATRVEKQRAIVFANLWKRGYYISSGSKFGGDYLLYSGDPLRFHSQFVASVISPEEMFPMLEIVTAGRLGTVVKKNHLLCAPKTLDMKEAREMEEPVIYLSVEWTGWN